MGELWSEAAPAGSPGWFAAALAAPRDEGTVRQGGTLLEYLRWRPAASAAAAQGVLLVHGAGASAQWWAFIGPALRALGYDVVALSNSGCGRSGLKVRYSAREFGSEVLAVARELGLLSRTRRPIVVAHSFGSVVSLQLALSHGELFEGVIMTDVRLEDTTLAEAEAQRATLRSQREGDKKFTRRERWLVHTDAPPVAKFKLAPLQECNQPYVLEFIANTSAVRVGAQGGWSWVGDPDRYRKLNLHEDTPYMLLDEVRLAQRKVPLAFIYGSETFFFKMPTCRDTVLGGKLRAEAPVTVIQGAAHHLLLDEPVAFIAAVQTYLLMWDSRRTHWQQQQGVIQEKEQQQQQQQQQQHFQQQRPPRL
jgi:pimeloyl-ACP methyl ester carboxylesterase